MQLKARGCEHPGGPVICCIAGSAVKLEREPGEDDVEMYKFGGGTRWVGRACMNLLMWMWAHEKMMNAQLDNTTAETPNAGVGSSGTQSGTLN